MRRQEEGPIDEVLSQARMTADPFHDYDDQAALARIAARVTAPGTRDQGTHPLLGEGDQHTPGPTPLPRRRTALHEYAAQTLDVLAVTAVSDHAAIASLALLADDLTAEPASWTAFACLLHLAGHEGGPVFWWQFAAGAGSATAAHCLYLHHLQSSDRQAARWWCDQTAALHADGGDWILDEPPAPLPGDVPPGRYGTPGTSSPPPSAGVHRWAVAHRLAASARELPTGDDLDHGTIPLPSPGLAAVTTRPRGTDRRLAAIEQDLTAPAPQGPTPDHHAPWPSTTYTLTTGLRHLTDTMPLYNTQEDVVGSLMAVVARLTSS